VSVSLEFIGLVKQGEVVKEGSENKKKKHGTNKKRHPGEH